MGHDIPLTGDFSPCTNRPLARENFLSFEPVRRISDIGDFASDTNRLKFTEQFLCHANLPKPAAAEQFLAAYKVSLRR
jgi:hypothetical protein